MRKAVSIFLLLVLLFNIVGYRVWFFYAEKQSDAALEATLDKNDYQENDLITIQIPLNNPYILEESNFQRVNGEINYQGKNYHFVKKRVTGGNVILQCIPDGRKMVLKSAKTEFGNAVNDLPANGKNSSRSNLQKNFSGSDYNCQYNDFRIKPLYTAVRKYHLANQAADSDPNLSSPAKPPEFPG